MLTGLSWVSFCAQCFCHCFIRFFPQCREVPVAQLPREDIKTQKSDVIPGPYNYCWIEPRWEARRLGSDPTSGHMLSPNTQTSCYAALAFVKTVHHWDGAPSGESLGLVKDRDREGFVLCAFSCPSLAGYKLDYFVL